MTPPVTLTCWTCGHGWQHARRPGQYPNRCPGCTSTELAARRLARRARILGLHARVDRHDRQGYVCVLRTPWHPEPVIVRDDHDLRYLLNELASEPAARSAA